MAQPRYKTTVALLGLLSDTPITVSDIVRALGCTIPAAQNAAQTLLASGEASEVQVKPLKGKIKRGFIKPRPVVRADPPPREEYKGEPLPLRYVPRSEPYISMQCSVCARPPCVTEPAIAPLLLW